MKLLDKPETNLVPDWTFAVIGHPRSDYEEDANPLFRRALNVCNSNNVDILFLGGDNILGYNTSLRRYKRDIDKLAEIIDSVSFPVFVAPGNHDYVTREQKEYFESILNKTYMRITRDTINFLLLDTVEGNLDVFDGRQFQIRYTDDCIRKYYLDTIPRNSGRPIPFSENQFTLFKKTLLDGGTNPLEDDYFELPHFYGIIMCHPVWRVTDHDWNRRFHKHLIGNNAFVFCGDHQTTNPEYVNIDNVHYINTAISANVPSFVIGRFYKRKGLYLSEAALDGNTRLISFK